ncbi:unnamed protein product, partial [Brassica oleracea]
DETGFVTHHVDDCPAINVHVSRRGTFSSPKARKAIRRSSATAKTFRSTD